MVAPRWDDLCASVAQAAGQFGVSHELFRLSVSADLRQSRPIFAPATPASATAFAAPAAGFSTARLAAAAHVAAGVAAGVAARFAPAAASRGDGNSTPAAAFALAPASGPG